MQVKCLFLSSCIRHFFFKKLIFRELHLMSFLYVFPEIPLSGCHPGPFFSRTRKREKVHKSIFGPFSNMHVTKKSPSQAGELYMGPSTLQFARKTCKNAGEMLFLFRKQCKIHGFGLFLSCPPLTCPHKLCIYSIYNWRCLCLRPDLSKNVRLRWSTSLSKECENENAFHRVSHIPVEGGST